MADAPDKSSVGVSLFWAAILALLGVMAEGEEGLLPGGLLGLMLGQIFYLRGRVDELRRRIRLQEMSSAAAHHEVREAEMQAVAPQPPPVAAEAAATPVLDPPTPPLPPAPSTFDLAFQRGLAWLTRGNPLARVGVVILFFGGAFLARYAAEHSMFPLELRFAGIGAVALILLIFGWRLRDTRSVYAQTLQGGGIAGLYLTVFAAAKLYQMLPPSLALGLLVAVALSAAVLAVAQNALALAVIGTAGGFLAPVLVSTGSANHVALFIYYAVLNLGIFTVAWFRAWRVLNLLGFIFTFGITGAFRALAYAPDKMLTTDLFLWLFFLLYVAVSILFALRQKPELKGYVSASLVFGLPLVSFGIHGTLVSQIEYALALSALALGAFYLMLAWALLRSRQGNLELLAEAFAALGLIFGSLAVPLAFDARTTAATWAVEGAGLLWLGLRQKRRLARAFGALLQVLGGIGYLGSLREFGALPPLLNSALFGSLMLALAGLLSGRWLYACRASLAGYEHRWHGAFALWAALWWLLGGDAEIRRSFASAGYGATLLWFAAGGLLLHIFATRCAWPFARTLAMWLAPVGALLVLAGMLDEAHPLEGWAAIGWPALLATQAALLWREDRIGARPLRWLHAGSLWLLALLSAWELHGQIGQRVTGVWDALPWGLVPAALLALLARPRLLPQWPLERHADVYRVLGAAPLAVCGALWLIAMSFGSRGDAGPLPYLPLLNPLDLGCALLLTSLVLWWQGLDPGQRLRLWRGRNAGPGIVLASLIFLWLNAALIRALHWHAGTPLSLDGIAHSTLVQAALSVFWGLLGFGAMVFAARRSQRGLWLAGAALMGVVVAKLFLVDLSGTGTLARIVSFLFVGGLLLVTGYLSPLPPKQKEEAAA